MPKASAAHSADRSKYYKHALNINGGEGARASDDLLKARDRRMMEYFEHAARNANIRVLGDPVPARSALA